MEGRNYAEYILKNYNQIKRELKVKEALLDITLSEAQEDIIEGMNFERFQGERVSHSKVTDKTAAIALDYKRARERVVMDLEMDIRKRKLELLKVDTAMEVLDEKEQRVIRGIYIDMKSRSQLCRELYISEGTLNRWRKKGIASINQYICLK